MSGPVALAGLLLVVAAIAPTAAFGQLAYVPNQFSASVTVFSTATDQVVGAPIPVGEGPVAVAITPDGATAYVVDQGADAVTVIDTATEQATGTIPVGSEPLAIAITPDGSRAYVSNYGGTKVSVIDTASNQVVEAVTVGQEPASIAITPDGKTALVARYGPSEIDLIDTRTNKEVGSPIPVQSLPAGIAIAPDGARAYVPGFGTNKMAVVDLATDTVVGSPIAVGQEPRAVAITPDGQTVYVASWSTESVRAISTQTDKVVGSPIAVGEYPRGIAISPNGRYAYVTNAESENVSVIDTRTNQPVGAPIATGLRPFEMAIAPDQSPLAEFTIAGSDVGAPIAFSAAGASVAGGSLDSYAWSFGDGATASGPSVSHAYTAPGTYQATLTVDDGEGCPGFLFSGQTAFCNGSSLATKTQTLTLTPAVTAAAPPISPALARPRVRVSCPKRAKPGGCRLALQVVSSKPKRVKGKVRKPQAESAVARIKLGAGKSAFVTLRPKPKFAARLEAAKSLLVRQTLILKGRSVSTYRRLKVIT